MGKRRGQIQIAVDKIDAEILELQHVRDRLLEAMHEVPKRKLKVTKAQAVAVKDDKAS